MTARSHRYYPAFTFFNGFSMRRRFIPITTPKIDIKIEHMLKILTCPIKRHRIQKALRGCGGMGYSIGLGYKGMIFSKYILLNVYYGGNLISVTPFRVSK